MFVVFVSLKFENMRNSVAVGDVPLPPPPGVGGMQPGVRAAGGAGQIA